MRQKLAIKTLDKLVTHMFVFLNEASGTELIRYDLGEDFFLLRQLLLLENYIVITVNGNLMLSGAVIKVDYCPLLKIMV
ncbi:hypothetical protein GCM10020331_004250 [Ectobacillus funiculus]